MLDTFQNPPIALTSRRDGREVSQEASSAIQQVQKVFPIDERVRIAIEVGDAEDEHVAELPGISQYRSWEQRYEATYV